MYINTHTSIAALLNIPSINNTVGKLRLKQATRFFTGSSLNIGWSVPNECYYIEGSKSFILPIIYSGTALSKSSCSLLHSCYTGVRYRKPAACKQIQDMQLIPLKRSLNWDNEIFNCGRKTLQLRKKCYQFKLLVRFIINFSTFENVFFTSLNTLII